MPRPWRRATRSAHAGGRTGCCAGLADNERVLVAAHEAVSRAAAGGRRVALAAEWLLDNFWVIEQQIVLARRHLPPGYNRQPAASPSGPSAGFPRVYDMALEPDPAPRRTDRRRDGHRVRHGLPERPRA